MPKARKTPSDIILKAAATARKPAALKKKVPQAPIVTKKVAVIAVKKVMPVAMKKAAPTPVRSVKKKKRDLQIGAQFTIAASAIAVLFVLAFFDRVTFSTLPSSAATEVTSTIGLEHDQPLALSVLVARKEQAGYVSITNQSNDEIHISVPSDWTRSEVTGAPLKDVTQDIPVFGFTRWKLPARAGMKMLLTSAPDSIFFDSPSTSTAAITIQTIDLTDLKAQSRVVLLKNQVLVQLWGQNE